MSSFTKIIFLILVVVLGVYAVSFYSKDKGSGALKEDLKNFIVPLVSIDGKTYTIEDGLVKLDGNIVSSSVSDKIMRVGYASVLNRFNPMYGIEGTDPDELKKSLVVLDAYAKRIAPFYDKGEDAIVSNNFYPIDFLNAVAEAERVRQDVIKTPSLNNVTDYYQKLGYAIDQELSYIDKLIEIFTNNSAFTSIDPEGKYVFLDGYTNRDAYPSAFKQYRLQVESEKNELNKRVKCLNEFSSDCQLLSGAFKSAMNTDKNLSGFKIETLPKNVADNNKLLSLYSKNSLSKLSQKNQIPNGDLPIIMVTNSQCFTNSTTTYYQSMSYLGKNDKAFSIDVIDDLYFYDSKTYEGRQIPPLAKKEVPFLYHRAANLYMCTSSGNDLTRAITLDTVKSLITNEPITDRNIPELSGANDLQEKISKGDVIYEPEIDSYITELKASLSKYGEVGPSKVVGQGRVLSIERLVSIYNQKSPRLNEVINNVNDTNVTVETLDKQEIKIPLTVLFYMRGYYPFLLLSYNKSASDKPLKFVIPESYDYSKFGLVSYNDVIKNKYSEKEVLKMMIRLHEIKSQ